MRLLARALAPVQLLRHQRGVVTADDEQKL